MNNKKYKIRFIEAKNEWNAKLHALYYKEPITNNKNVDEQIKFIESYNKEVRNLIDMKVFDPKIKLPRQKIPKNLIIPINTILNIKRDGLSKARIVCRGDLQDENVYGAIETSILDLQSLKLLLLIANNKNMLLKTFDINHAFLYASFFWGVGGKLYIPHPNNNRCVTPLRKALCGLKQSPRNWNETLKKIHEQFRFT